MKFRPLSIFALLVFLLAFEIQAPGAAEDWSIRKINPFGKRTAGKKVAKEPKQKIKKSSPKQVKPKRENTKQDDQAITDASTTREIRKSFSRFGQETAAAFVRTRDALTPEFDWPKWEPLRIKFPRLMSNADPEKVVK
ncbi:MAG: hypothetical protein P8M53_12615 [Pirellulales bacterium]|nr:hypothetical protein [Pirellulales bacterium]